ncbi:MAG: gluconate 2-dehydrogenase subunit 3 family protein [Longimicrobiales bacterium]|nr:gluconate 2-dehydrogenase subunit 3 family protein [Longimicrobiales bacterium]
MSGLDRKDRSLPILGQDPPLESLLPMDRRQALKVMAIAAAAPGLGSCSPGEAGSAAGDASSVPNPTSNPLAAGTAWDPDLVAPSVPWERVLLDDELQSLAALCDVIIPEDDRSPSASQIGAHDFIDEWVSAPYDGHRRELVTIRGGLAWIDREAVSRFGTGLRFRDLSSQQKRAICDDICYQPDVAAGFEVGARFFDRVRDLTSTAFWTTQAGMDDLQYIGNVPLPQWDPPPPEVLRHIGIE